MVLRVPDAEGPSGGRVDCCPHPDPSKTGVVMTRAVTERKLYLQVRQYTRCREMVPILNQGFKIQWRTLWSPQTLK